MSGVNSIEMKNFIKAINAGLVKAGKAITSISKHGTQIKMKFAKQQNHDWYSIEKVMKQGKRTFVTDFTYQKSLNTLTPNACFEKTNKGRVQYLLHPMGMSDLRVV